MASFVGNDALAGMLRMVLDSIAAPESRLPLRYRTRIACISRGAAVKPGEIPGWAESFNRLAAGMIGNPAALAASNQLAAGAIANPAALAASNQLAAA